MFFEKVVLKLLVISEESLCWSDIFVNRYVKGQWFFSFLHSPAGLFFSCFFCVFITFPTFVMALFEIHQGFKGNFLNELRVTFNDTLTVFYSIQYKNGWLAASDLFDMFTQAISSFILSIITY